MASMSSPTSRLRTVVVLLGITLLAGCAAEGPAEDDRLVVVATTTQVGSIAREIGGAEIDLTVLLEPGVEAHDFQLRPSAAGALENADLVLMSGAGLEDWLEDAIADIGADATLADLSEGVQLRTDPDSGSVDPHYWLDARNAAIMAGNAAEALATERPAAEAFAERADALIERLEAADAEIRDMMAPLSAEERRIVTDHDALGYFIDAYGLEHVGSVFSSLDVSSEPSAQQIEALVAEMRATGVRAIFTESVVDPRLARTVAEEADVRLVDEPLYTDSLGPEGSGADTLDGMLLHNARVIHDGLTGD
jgi:zinc/manganese transport system substrate-binding protein